MSTTVAKMLETETHQYMALYAGWCDGRDHYAVFRVARGRTVQCSSWYADVSRANERARELGERDGVQWFGYGGYGMDTVDAAE